MQPPQTEVVHHLPSNKSHARLAQSVERETLTSTRSQGCGFDPRIGLFLYKFDCERLRGFLFLTFSHYHKVVDCIHVTQWKLVHVIFLRCHPFVFVSKDVSYCLLVTQRILPGTSLRRNNAPCLFLYSQP